MDKNRAPEKPAFGSPCNGCGLCCAREVCVVGQAIFGEDTPAPCPGMRFDGTKFRCSLVEMADQLSAEKSLFLRLRMGIGVGCDSDVEPTHAEQERG